jgi:glycosyltransferase involved in cell wall biosynthesis
MPRVSVVIPAFNQAQFLGAAIDSALHQTHRDLEVVVVDDGSTDSTGDVLASYAQRRAVRVVRQENAGVGAARNAGFTASTGSLVCFLDADDYYHPDRIARQIDRFERRDVGFAYCDIVRVDAHGAVVDDYDVGRARRVVEGDIFESLLEGGYFPPHTVIVRREVFEASGGFDRALGGHADLDLWLRLAGAGVRADFLPEKLAYYRLHDASMSRDESHMRHTRRLALEKAVRAHPERAAAALSALQDLGHDLHAANRWLQDRLAEYRPYSSDQRAWFTYDFVEHVGDGRLSGGAPDAAAAWDVRIGGEASRALLLHPPATLAFVVPDAGAGVLRGAVGLHPDVWGRTGPTAFEVLLDGYPAFRRVVDPRQTAHRGWLHFEIDVPASPAPHAIALTTEALETRSHQWALWRSLRYFRTPERSAR